ncbi:hypothetical protein C8J57DRAFT_1321046 [Mycena rebaudengoi]|nr:hypothetical protein C8J57DRAFT_1321046 [Mycena rebaudengoi]
MLNVRPTAESSSPILGLPFDITSEIFVHCLLDDEPLPHPNHAPIVLTRICQEWRATALNTPNIWSVVRGVSGHLDAKYIHLFDTWLARAQNCPLSITLDCNHPDELLIHFLNRHMGRCHEISLDFPFTQYQLLSAPDSLPLLQRLVVASWGELRGDDGPSSPSISAFEYAPRLHHVRMRVGLGPSDVALPWEQLTSFECDSFEIVQCLQVLKNGPNLAHCVLNATYPSELLPSVTPHPCLRHLTLGNWYGVNVLPYISLPGLTKLELLTDLLETESPFVTNFISRSQCELKDITFGISGHWVGLTDRLIELFATVPSLTHLRLTTPATRKHGVIPLCARLHDNSAILPHLQLLSLSCFHLGDEDSLAAITDMLDARFLNGRLTSFILSVETISQDIYPSPAIRARWDELRGLGMVLDIRSLSPVLDLTLPQPESPS